MKIKGQVTEVKLMEVEVTPMEAFIALRKAMFQRAGIEKAWFLEEGKWKEHIWEGIQSRLYVLPYTQPTEEQIILWNAFKSIKDILDTLERKEN